jgi:AcrR family transcriptional regulator
MSDGRPGATRSEAARLAILRTAATQLIVLGWNRLTIEGIARGAGVGKHTIYRWWSSKSAIIADCLLEGILLPDSFAVPDTGDLRADLTAWVDGFLDRARDPHLADVYRSLICAACEDEALGEHIYAQLGGDGTPLTQRLDAALAAGVLPRGTPTRELIQAIIGAVVMRFVSRGPVDDDLGARIVRAVLGPALGEGAQPGEGVLHVVDARAEVVVPHEERAEHASRVLQVHG